MRHLFLNTVWLLFCYPTLSQNLVPVIFLGMSECGYNETGVRSLMSNPAGLCELSGLSSLLSSNQRYFSDGILELMISTGIPIGKYTGGEVHFKRYGDEIFAEQSIGISIGKRLFDRLALGIGMDYYQLSIEGYGSSSGLNVQLGVQARISKEMDVSSFLFLPLQKEEEISSSNIAVMHLDIRVRAAQYVNLHAGIKKDSDHKPGIKFGLEYMPVEKLSLQTGIITTPVHYCFGAGFELFHKFNIHVSSVLQPDLGWSAGLGIIFENPKESL